MKNALFISARKDGYSPAQVGETMTVKELIRNLQCYSDDTEVFVSNDGGYTYGGLTELRIFEKKYNEEDN